jgi:hypothetical protein
MVGKGKGRKASKMMMEEMESDEEMSGGRIELSKLIALGKNGQHYMLDPSALSTKPRMPIPRDNVSGKGRRVLEGGVLGSFLPDVKFRDTLSGAGKLSITHEGIGLAGAGAESEQLWSQISKMAKPSIGTSTAVKGPAISGMGRAGAGKLSITHEGMGLAGAGDARKKRAEIVKKVMKQRGVSLAEASKIVKSEGLYKK